MPHETRRRLALLLLWGFCWSVAAHLLGLAVTWDAFGVWDRLFTSDWLQRAMSSSIAIGLGGTVVVGLVLPRIGQTATLALIPTAIGMCMALDRAPFARELRQIAACLAIGGFVELVTHRWRPRTRYMLAAVLGWGIGLLMFDGYGFYIPGAQRLHMGFVIDAVPYALLAVAVVPPREWCAVP